MGISRTMAAVIGVVGGVLVGGMAVGMVKDGRESVRRVQLLSDVHDPMRQCLADIVRTQERGDAGLAERKVELLRRRWGEYLEGTGTTPEAFAGEVMGLAASTPPGR